MPQPAHSELQVDKALKKLRAGPSRSELGVLSDERRVFLDDLNALLRQHCRQLGQRLEAQQERMLERLSVLPAAVSLEVPAAVSSDAVVPTTASSEAEAPVSESTDLPAGEKKPTERTSLIAAAPCTELVVVSADVEGVEQKETGEVAEEEGEHSTWSSTHRDWTESSKLRERTVSGSKGTLGSSRWSTEASFFANELARKKRLLEIEKGCMVNSKPSVHSCLQEFRMKLRAFVHSCGFESTTCVLIVVNMLFFGFETEYMAQQRTEVMPAYFAVVGQTFAAVFLLELVLRLLADGITFFTSEYWLWNILDLVIISVTFIELALDNTVDPADQGQSPNLTHMRVIRIVRTIRILRVVRIMKLFRSLRILVYSVLNTLKSLCWVITMLLLIIYIFALLFTQAANTHIVHMGLQEVPTNVDRYFGSLARSIYTLFKVITGGMNWEYAAEPLQSIGISWTIIFVGFIAYNYFAVLNVVTGLVCQTAIESAHHDLDVVVQTQLSCKQDYTAKFKDLFKNIDLQDTGKVTLKDLEERLQDSSMQDYFAAMDLTTNEAWSLFKLLDIHESSVLDVDDFVTGCLRLRGNARSIDMHMLMYESKWTLKQLAALSRAVERQEALFEEHLANQL